MTDGKPHICTQRVLPGDLLDSEAGLSALEAAIVIAKKWPTGATLRIRFMGGTAEQHQLVRSAAKAWEEHANIRFSFDGALDAPVRIAFDENDGSWSYIGQDALSIPRDAPTMNFGWLDHAVVYHEFGHLLGLIHEHQNPEGGIEWNEAVVLEDLAGSPNFWTEAEARRNVLDKYAAEQLNGTSFDPDSIMLYFFPPEWTTNGQATKANEVISATDAAFIGSALAYPFEPDSDEPDAAAP